MNIKKFKIEYLIYLFLLLTPFLDSLSFIFRYYYPNSIISPTTIIRPIIPCILLIYIFIKDKKSRKDLFILGIIYLVYTLLHLLTFKNYYTEFNAGSVFSELQYNLNYTYMIGLFYVLVWFIKQKRLPHLRKYITLMLSCYLVLIYISIITGTSSTTYLDGVGFKGWNASGNGLSALLILGFGSIFTYLLKYIKKWYIILFILSLFIFLIVLFGTRTALYGSVLIVFIYGLCYIYDYVYIKKSVNLKKFGIILTTIIILIGSVLVGGKNSFKRRENIKEVGSEMIDPLTNEETHLTGDLTNFVVQIKNDNLDISLSDEQINALLKTYDKANEIELPNSNRRLQQLIYQHYLYLEEFSIETFLFGTGYLNNYPELTLEMELPAFLYNFGVIGLILYLGPFIFIIIKGIITFIKKRGIVSINYLMYFICIILSLFLSCLTGYVYFYVSSMLVVLMLYILFIGEEDKL